MTSSEVARHTAVSEETQSSTFPATHQRAPLLSLALGLAVSNIRLGST